MIRNKHLLLPISYWDGNAPTHEITCVVRGTSFLFTGSSSGELCCWKTPPHCKDDDCAQNIRCPQYTPTSLLIHKSLRRCTALQRSLVGNEETVLAASSDGYLSVWAASGAHCYRAAPVLPFTATRLHSYKRKGISYVVCSGTSVCVVKLPQMSVIQTFKHHGSLVGSALACIFHPNPPACCANKRTLFLFTLTTHGMLQVWDLEDVNIYKPVGQNCCTEASPTFSCRVAEMPSTLTGLAVSADGERFLVLMQNHWMVCRMNTFKLELLVNAGKKNQSSGGGGWVGCSFMSTNSRIALWSRSHVHVYVLPGVEAEFGKTARPWLQCMLDISPTPAVLVDQDDIFVGTAQGSVRHFAVPKLAFEDWKQDSFGRPLAFTHAMGLIDVFPPLETSNSGAEATVSVVLQDAFMGLLLIRGHRSGLVVYQRLLNTTPVTVELEGHTEPITALVAIPSHLSVAGRPLLVSASEDCWLRVWSIDSARLIWKYQFSAPIYALFWHPPSTNSPANEGPEPVDEKQLTTKVGELGDLVYAVSNDDSVRVISLAANEVILTLRGHDSNVVGVYRNAWCDAMDYVVVETGSGTVYVWVLSDGLLERLISPQHGASAAFLKAKGLKESVTTNNFSASPPVSARLKKARDKLPRRRDFDKKEHKEATAAAAAAAAAASIPGVSSDTDVQVIEVPVNRSQWESLHVVHFNLNIHQLLTKLHMTTYSKEKGGLARLIDPCLLGLLFDYETGRPDIDTTLKENLNLVLCRPVRALGALSDNDKATAILFPTQSMGLNRWQYSPHLSATHALALSTVCMSLLSGGDPYLQIYFSRIVAQYNVILPETLKRYVEPDLGLLATYALNYDEDIFTVSRLLLQSVLERVGTSARAELAKQWGAHYTDENTRESSNRTQEGENFVSDEELMACIVLCLIFVHHANKSKKTKLVAKGNAIRTSLEEAKTDGKTEDIAADDDDADDDEAPDLDDPMLHVDTSDEINPAATPSNMQGARAAAVQDGPMDGDLNFNEKQAERGENKSEPSTPKHADAQQTSRATGNLPSNVSAVNLVRPSVSAMVRANPRRPADDIESKAPNVAQTLLKVLMSNDVEGEASNARTVNARTAVDLFGKAFPILRHHVIDLVMVIRRLHQLSLTKNPLLATASHRALLQAGKGAPKHFVTCMGKEALNSRNTSRARSSALMAIVALVRKYPAALAKVLPSAVQIITRCLDPSEPALRKSLLHASTAALHVLVQRYPMVTFHQTSQRFAIGTGKANQCVIIIYDLRTATKWRILEGHLAAVSAISFSPKGNILVSYSAEEDPPTFRVWNTGVSGFFSSLLGIRGRCTKVHKLAPCQPVLFSAFLQVTRITWTDDQKTVTLQREDHSVASFKI